MLIRCEKCSTTYELEERLIPPGGAPVQCSRCEHVFRAYPPGRSDAERGAPESERERRPGLEIVPPPADDLPDDAAALPRSGPVPVAPVAPLPEPEVEPVEPPVSDWRSPAAGEKPEKPEAPVSPPYAALTKTPAPVPVPPPEAGSPGAHREAPPPSTPGQAAAPPAPPHRTPAAGGTYKPPAGPTIPPGKPVRKVPNPELEGETVSVASVPRKAVSFDVRPKKRGKSSWIVTGAVGLLVLLIIAGVISWWQEQRAAKEAARVAAVPAAPQRPMTKERQAALALLMRDDAASLERAAAQLDDLVRREQSSAARADRALALALLSQQAKEEAERLERRALSIEQQRAGGTATNPNANPDPDAARRGADLELELETTRAEVAPLNERAGRLLSEARAELDAIPASMRESVAAARGRAWVQLVSGAQADAARTAESASGAAGDAWLALVAVVARLPEDASGEDRDRAAGELEALAARHPDFVRPLLLAGRIRAGLGDGDRALADLDRVLELNPQHVEARRLRAEVAAASGAPAGQDAATPNASPAENGHSQGGNAPTAPGGR